jgi:prepilin-type N-terminal cleavage/methylation domain-containing protein
MSETNKRAMTLVEVMVAIFISTIVLTAIYGVWIRVQRQIARSNAKQTLQHELRTAANHLAKDLKAIREGTFEAPPGEQSADGTAMKISFDRFIETEDEKIAQDSTTKVEYSLKNGLLTRKTDDSLDILSVNVDSMIIARAVDEASLGATDLESTDEDFKAGREAMLDVAITGKKRIAGSRDEMYHIERTSLVMRDEYYKNTNKTYISNFDLAKLETDEVMVNDSSQDVNFGPGGAFTLEQLENLDPDQLRGMRDTQNELYNQANEAFNNINDNINNTETGNDFLDTLAFWSDSEGEKVADMKDDLEDADTQEEVEAAVNALETYAEGKEESFLSRSVSGWSSMSQEDKMLYKKAYDLKVQDRAIKAANEKAKEDNPDAEESPMMIDLVTEVQDQTYEDESGTQTISASQNEELQEEARELKDAYDRISLDWMGEFGDEDEEIQAYNAAKSLITQGRSKLDTIEMRDQAKENRDLIDQVLGS